MRKFSAAVLIAPLFMSAQEPKPATLLPETAKIFPSVMTPLNSIAQNPNAKPGHTYWRNVKSGSIMDIWPCKEPHNHKATICMVGHTVDVSTEAARQEAADNLEQSVDFMMRTESWRKYCGFGPRIYNLEEKNNVKRGQLKVAFDWLRENGNGYKEGHTFEIEFRTSGKNLKMTGWLSWFPLKKEDTDFILVDPKDVPPPCMPPHIINHSNHMPPYFITQTP